MRAHHHVIAVAAVLVIGLGAKQYFFPPRQADANINPVLSVSMNLLQMHSDLDVKSLRMQKMKDMSFVFSDSD